MNSPYVVDRLSEVERTITRVSAFGASDPELAAYLSAYLVVYVSGVYEDCIEHLFQERADRGADSVIQNYVKVTLAQGFRNPDFGNIVSVLRRFGINLAEELKEKTRVSSREALDSIVNNKNSVAHGHPLNATLDDVAVYYRESRGLLENLEDILDERRTILR